MLEYEINIACIKAVYKRIFQVSENIFDSRTPQLICGKQPENAESGAPGRFVLQKEKPLYIMKKQKAMKGRVLIAGVPESRRRMRACPADNDEDGPGAGLLNDEEDPAERR